MLAVNLMLSKELIVIKHIYKIIKTSNCMKGVNKKGVSPVVASVLMIMLVMVLATIVFLWARGFIGEQIEKFGKPIDEYCGRVKFDVARYGDELEIVNTGNVDIGSLSIKMTKGGNSEMRDFPLKIDAGASVSGEVDLDMSDTQTPDDIFVYPVLIGNIVGEGRNNIFTCLDAGVKI